MSTHKPTKPSEVTVTVTFTEAQSCLIAACIDKVADHVGNARAGVLLDIATKFMEASAARDNALSSLMSTEEWNKLADDIEATVSELGLDLTDVKLVAA